MADFSITEAAQQLGVSTATVKRRLHNGTLKGRQDPRPQGFVWVVELDCDGDNDDNTTGSDAALIAALHAQVDQLTEELASRRQEVQQLHVLLSQAQAALPPPAPARRGWLGRLFHI